MRMTRRELMRFAGGATLIGGALRAEQDPDFTIVVVPDSQYLAASCTSMYSRLIQRIIDDAASWNTKAVIHVGDCQDGASFSVVNSQGTVMQAAYGLLDTAGIPFIGPPGNHDYEGGISSINRALIGRSFISPNFMSATYRSGVLGSGLAIRAGSDMAYWVGSYDTSGANTAIRLVIGRRKFLIIALEFFPRSLVLNWAKGLHDTYAALGYDVWFTTHGYLTDQLSGNPQCARASTYGPNHYSQGAAPASNSGLEMWRGYYPSDSSDPSDATWAGFKAWSNLFGCTCGHWVDPLTDSGSYWSRIPISSESARAQTVQQIFANAQERDNSTSWCPAGTPNGSSDTARLFYLKFRPSLGTLEGYMFSANSGLYATGTGSAACSSAVPVNLFGSLAYSGVPRLFPGASPLAGA